MIVDTSALVAVLWREAGHKELLDALLSGPSLLPAPVRVELERVIGGTRSDASADADALLAELGEVGLTVLPFNADHARVAAAANIEHGTGNGRGGTLNLLDLMVYACAKVERRPILCTGRDFAATDAAIHSASRID